MFDLFSITRESKVINVHNSSHTITIRVGWLTFAVIVGTILLHFFA